MLTTLKQNYKIILLSIIATMIIVVFLLNSSKQTKTINDVVIKTSTSSTIISNIVISSTTQHNSKVSSWLGKKVDVILTEQVGTVQVPMGKVSFNPNSDKPITTDLPARTYEITTTIKNDKPTTELKINNIIVPTTTTYKVAPEPIFALRAKVFTALTLSEKLNPNLNIGVSLNFIKFDKFSLLSPGIAYTNNNGLNIINLTIEPISYNIYKNTQIGLIITKSVFDDSFSAGVSLSIEIK